jgi:p25-alpha
VRTSDIKMDSKAFAKTMKEAGVMDSRLNTTRVDLCFTKAADKVPFDTSRR